MLRISLRGDINYNESNKNKLIVIKNSVSCKVTLLLDADEMHVESVQLFHSLSTNRSLIFRDYDYSDQSSINNVKL